MLTPLPVDPFLPDLIATLRQSDCLVLQAEPGAGKTTRVPRALLDAGLAGDREVWVLQPRRLAARLAARRIADEHGEKLGDLVGYQVRFEEVAGPRTRLRFMTEGVLTRKLLAESGVPKAGIVVLDEFHERHLDGDLCLALLRQLQKRGRPDLKIVVMSATLEAEPVSRYLGEAPQVFVPGRQFDIAVEHQQLPDQRPLEQQVASAVRRLVDEGLDGDVLVFLPGAAEIRKAREACEPIANRAGLLVVPLHGELPAAEQDKAVRPAGQRKVILSTNVAETSVTIEGVVAVVDSGLARIAGHSAWSGLSTLKVGRVSKASAIQRAGRAGRLRAGRCLRLYTRHDFDTRPDHEAAEVRRLDLAEAAMALHGAGVRDLRAFSWFEAPEEPAIVAADELLSRLGALSVDGGLTELGKRMLRVPLHPRQARVLLEAEARGRGDDGCLLAALLGEREIRLEARGGIGGRREARVNGPSDLLESLEAFRDAERAGFDAAALRSRGLDIGAAQAVERVRRNLSRLVRSKGEVSDPDPDRPLLMATLAGYPDRVARRRKGEGSAPSAELVLVGGGTAKLSDQSVVRDAPFLVAVDAEERGLGAHRQSLVRVASEIEPDWLLDLFSERVREEVEVRWNSQGERVEAHSRLLYENLVIEESRNPNADPARTREVLLRAALDKGIESFAEPEALRRLLARMGFVNEASGAGTLPAVREAELEAVLGELCEGRRSFAELREAGLLEALKARLSGQQLALLERLAPERIKLPGGRSVAINYETGKPPWIESRLQDFFGLAAGPAVAGGRVPLVLHLLAPNHRAVQVTTDLTGFWERHYPAIRKELCRKYPRHSWPEDPKTAAPPPVAPRRR